MAKGGNAGNPVRALRAALAARLKKNGFTGDMAPESYTARLLGVSVGSVRGWQKNPKGMREGNRAKLAQVNQL